ncbi:MAG: hypothetical protein IPP90_22065 [Gemmatimonadaceae bacterium]|nr:hypothetical protein [Gemmatimonadaceae bacterium]
MTDPGTQNIGNHTRWMPLFHFFAQPVTMFYALYQIKLAISSPTTDTIVYALFTFAVTCAVLTSRLMANTVQDRIIRLEETLRMQRILPASMHGDIAKITRGQFVALRFAPDAELPELVRRTVAGEFPNQKAIKQAIKNWRGDYLRA